MRVRVLVLVALTLVLVFAVGGVAAAQTAPTYTTPGDCYTCHGVAGTGAVGKVDFAVAPVDYNRCKTCHGAIEHNETTPQHWHNLYSRCSNCHGVYAPTMPDSSRFFQGYTLTQYGRFGWPESLTASPQTLHAQHSGAGWVNSLTWANSSKCQPCHKPVACSACHGDVQHTNHAVSQYPPVTYLQATGTSAVTAPSTCVNSSCHDPAKAATADFVPSCGSCHPLRVTYHWYDTVDHVADDGALDTIACSSCHSLDLATAHADPGATGTSCVKCHPMPRKSFAAWDQTCATGGCHTAGSTKPMHADAPVKHEVSNANQRCLQCHPGTDLGSIHVAAKSKTVPGATSCRVCHTLAGKPASSDCTVCHFTFEAHYDSARHQSVSVTCGGTGCHATPDLPAVHAQRNAAFGCSGCHSSVRAEVQYAIVNHLTGCGDCHGSISALGGHRDAHNAVPPLANADGSPNYSYVTGSAGTAPTGDCAGCHTANLVDEHVGLQLSGAWVVFPRRDAAGAALTCGTCHDQPVGSQVRNVIAARLSACEGCHSVHAPIPVAHTSAFVDSPLLACADCHSANIAAEHNGGYTSTAGLTGCDVCHALYTGQTSGAVTGDTAQSAISTANDTRCSACHAAYHTNASAHTAATAASLECGVCHATGQTAIDVTAVHATAAAGPCKVCHASSRIEVISGHTAECASCHAAEGVDYHELMTSKHTYSAMDPSCTTGTPCHVANTLPEEHQRTIAKWGYSSTCDLCHKNVTPGRIPATATADCSSCHTVHGDIATIHTATASRTCVDCHETGDVRQIHATTVNGSCPVCHSAPAGRINWTNPSIECTYCHGGYTQIDPNHYPASAHNASAETACDQCHYKDMKAEHSKTSVSPVVTCVSCHEAKVDNFTAAWNKTCAACHATKHGAQASKHVSTTTGCSGSGCHDITNVEAIHGKPTGPGCAACHVNAATPARTTNCADAACHPNVGTNHHESHNAAAANGSECAACHFMYLDDEHEALGYNCATCHDSTSAAVRGSITAHDRRCATCHPAAHAALAYEFNPARLSLHRTRADLPGMRSVFSANGTTYTWTLPSASSFLKSGWTTSSMTGCTDCHSYSGATGPHGATMKVNIDPAYPKSFRAGGTGGTAQLSASSSTGMSMSKGGSSAAGIICEKCHDLSASGSWSNIVHKEHDDRGGEGGYCHYCHTAVPHGWTRPRLLAYTTDPAPYSAYTGGVQRISLKSYTPNGWGKSDCGAACASDKHPLSGSSWPANATAPTAGTAAGTVTKSTGGALAGATVSIAGKTATTSSTGAYSIADITAGTYTMTVSATGYTPWSGPVAITAGATETQNVTLTANPTPTNIARTGSASASSQYSSTYSAAKAIDGSTTTDWRSLSTGMQWLRVDLGAVKTLTSIVVNWPSTYYAKSYEVQTSTDGTNWTMQYGTTNGSVGIKTVTLNSVSARYVRVYCTTANSSNYRIWELEAWGY